ncbi:MAG: DUF3987 domain-containing protein [Planctomycetaceae bacterium]|nr:DUF3987 domain-containing protein [Planctomycetaceae bacterium]
MHNLTLEAVIGRLESRGYAVKRSGGVYRSQCPAHDGKDLNLAFTLGDKGQVVFTCHSHHCTYEEIMKALGVEKQEKKATSMKTVHPTYEEAVRAASYGVQRPGIPPDKIYRYNNLDGSENLFVLRWNTENGKEVRPVTKVSGGYICGESSEGGLPIYNLPKIAALFREPTVRIFVAEGEKAADCVTTLGFTATTSAFGSGSAHKADWDVLDRLALRYNKKPEIVILPDNDPPGEKYAETLVGKLTQFKSQPTVKVVSLADHGAITGLDTFPKGGDIVDLCELLDGKTETDILEMVERMIENTLPEAEIEDGNIEWEPFPVDLLPESIGRLCRESAKAKNIEPVYVGINAIAAVASVVGSAYKIELKPRDWYEPAILWTCLVAESGSGKSPGLDSATLPLRTLQSEADRDYDTKSDIYATEKGQYDLDYDDWKRARKRNPMTLPPVLPFAPKMETFLVDDATLEAIAEVLESNPFGILLVKDELAGWLKSFDCYRSGGGAKDLPAWLSIHGGRMFRINRKTGKKMIHSNNPAVSVCGGVQPLVLQRIVNENEDFFDSGLTARILFAMPPDKPSYWTEAETSDEALMNYERIFRTLYRWRSAENAPSPENPLIVRLSPEAKDLFTQFFNVNVDERMVLDSDMKAFWAKFASYAARLALVFHVVQRIEDGAPMEELPGETMQRAIRLIMWFKREAARILKLLRQTKCEIDFEAQAVLGLIEQNGGRITVRELQHRRSKYRDKDGAKKAETLLDGLVRQGKLTSEQTMSGNGKTVLRYGLT